MSDFEVAGAHLRALPHPRYDVVLDGPDESTECLDCGRTDGRCDRVAYNSEPLCERPPKGWVCTRLCGHTGPCISLLETI